MYDLQVKDPLKILCLLFVNVTKESLTCVSYNHQHTVQSQSTNQC